MTDVVVTVPKDRWGLWIDEGDLPGEEWSGNVYDFYLGGLMPHVTPGERVYIVAYNRLRGYAPLVVIGEQPHGWSLVRHGGAVTITIPESIRGFQGFRYRWWDRADEVPFPTWRDPRG